MRLVSKVCMLPEGYNKYDQKRNSKGFRHKSEVERFAASLSPDAVYDNIRSR